jgi:hypothetical protein
MSRQTEREVNQRRQMERAAAAYQEAAARRERRERLPQRTRRPQPVFAIALAAKAALFLLIAVQAGKFMFWIISEQERREFESPPLRHFNAQRAWDEAPVPMGSFNEPAHDLGNVLWMAQVAKEAIAANPTRDNLLELKIVEECLAEVEAGNVSPARFAALKERLRAARSRIVPAERR